MAPHFGRREPLKAGAVGALVVVAGGVLVFAALAAKDRVQLERARRALDNATASLKKADARGARQEFVAALAAARGVSAVTGKLEPALALADEARSGALACEGFLELEEKRPAEALRELDAAGAGGLESAREKSKTARAALTLASARLLEQRGAGALAEKAYALAKDDPSATEADKAAAAQGVERARARAAIAAAESALARNELAQAKTAADEALEKVKSARATFDDAKQPAEIEARARAIAAMAVDQQAVDAFRKKLAQVLERAPADDDLERAAREAEAAKPPELLPDDPKRAELEPEVARLSVKRQKLLDRARSVEGMVLAIRGENGRPSIYIDRLEVSNKQYHKFVDEGKGYANSTFWEPDGERRRAAEQFLDSTGKPGPRAWADGKPEPEKLFHPVTGISVYEARAFARFSGKRLPTLDEWRAAAVKGDADFPDGPPSSRDVANLRIGEGPFATKRVGECSGRGPTGAQDLFGNVRGLVEVGAAAPGKVYAVGGSFETPPELARARARYPEFPLSVSNKDVGFRCAKELRWDD